MKDPPLSLIANDETNTSSIYSIYTYVCWFLSILTLRIPTYILHLVSYTITIELNFWSAVVLTGILLTCIYLVIRYRFLTVYSRLPEPDAVPNQAEAFDLQPDPSLFEDNHPNPPKYPTDLLKSLLASIKIFGYLEEPVFNELSRYLNTRRVLKGDVIFDDNHHTEKSFYIVMEGCVQVSLVTVSTKRHHQSYGEVSEGQPSEVIPLTEIKAGGTLSSLFTLLSLFTETIALQRAATDGEHREFYSRVATSSTHERALVKHDGPSVSAPQLREVKFHPNIIARATRDTTLAVIPAEAFHRLTQKFPNASAHIVQVILTRFQRVTFLTLNKYLSMSKELLEIEQKVTELANHSIEEMLFQRNDVRQMVEVARRAQTLRPRMAPAFQLDPPPKEAAAAQLIVRLGVDEFKSQTEIDAYHRLRQQTYRCMAEGLGVLASEAHAVPEAGEFANSHTASLASSDLESSEFSDDGMSTTSSSTPPTISPGSLRETFEDEVEFYYLQPDATIIDQGEQVDGLYLVLQGKINVTIDSPDRPAFTRTSSVSDPMFGKGELVARGLEKRARATRGSTRGSRRPFQILSGCLAGYMGSITGSPSFVRMSASNEVVVGFLSRKFINRLMERHPTLLLTLAKRLIHQLPPLLLQIDYALEWMVVSANKLIYRRGDPSDSIYIVLNGRLRTIDDAPPSGIMIVDEFGQGDSVGELEMLTDSPRPVTLHAIRDSELARMPKSLFDSIALAHPAVTIKISRMIAQRTQEQQAGKASGVRRATLGQNNSNLRTVGIIPVRAHVPIQEFSVRLQAAFHTNGESAALLHSSSAHAALGKHAFTRMGKLKLMSWMAEQEEGHRIVLLVADGAANSPWTQRCIRHADCILLVGIGDEDPSVGEFERILIGLKTTARKELVLLHPERAVTSGSTKAWLKARLWIHAHHHVQFPLKRPAMLKPTLFTTLHQLRDQFHRVYADVAGTPWSDPSLRQPATYTGVRSDYARLARRLCGKSIGVVLGGGGARGLSHIGFLRSLEESGVPIDMVGGCSIGAYIGGLYARDASSVAMVGRARAFSLRMASLWRKVADLTYPIISWFSGHEFNRGLWKSFNDLQIEDLWLPYYCVTTNITHSRLEVHQSGYVWRYVRASMSLSGFLPPLCDGDKLLVDGGYLDYLPVEVMKSLGADTIFAVDVSGEDSAHFTNYGDTLSGWYVLLCRLNPFSRANIPSLADIQSRLAYVSSVAQLEAAKRIPGCLYIRLPVQSYGTLQFGSFGPIEAVGYSHGLKCVKAWEGEGLLASWTSPKAHVPAPDRFTAPEPPPASASAPRPRLRRHSSM
ncbi:phosphatidylcholine and lysophosphatidylcholine phospholipase [Massospora cicadina]|nr:phosphatidylcholine and lysophosphatidylcholine phospholipase [Massospora cicadina]